ncbi:SpoIIE family protein phosphatase, partial [Gemmiger qucibialis]|uniref:SpoIIE family protein phosphatase n=1 Tax=Gemmiger qucibialis TaxID=2997294 RepID=UPI0022E49F31
VFCPGERRSGAAVFAAGCALGALAAPNLTGVLTLGLAAGAGLLGFLLCPEQALRAVFPPPAPPVGTQSLTSAARKLSGVADTLSDIAETVNAVCSCQMPPRGESYDYVVEFCAQHLCQNCARRNTCWVQGYSTAMDGLYALRSALEHNGRVELEDLPGQLSTCVHPADLCATVSHGYRLWCSRRQTRARAELLRTALTEQYSAMATALAQMAARLGRAGLPDPRREARTTQLFASLGLEPLECTVLTDLAGRVTAAVTLPRTSFTPGECRALAEEMGRICRRDFDPPEVTNCRTVTMLHFGERPLYRAVFGLASRPAPPETVSGDACRQFCDSAGRAQMLLCDGMGTGKPAAVDGQMAAKLTAQLLQAGFAAESAARLVNVALGLKNAGQESGATLDLLTLDLYTGRAGLFKRGGPSFLCRAGVVRTLDGASLPMGVLPTVTGRSTALTLDVGDTVMMVSDGALCDGSAWLCDQLTLSTRLGQSPQQTAEAVAASAVRRSGARQDDITVAIVRLERQKS